MTDLKIVSIGPETIATLGLPSWANHAEVALTYEHTFCFDNPAGDIVAVDVFDDHDNLLIGDGDDAADWVKPGDAGHAIASRLALVAHLVIRGDQYRITAPETIADGNYELP